MTPDAMDTPTPNPHRDEPTPQPDEGLRPEADPSVVRPDLQEEVGPLEGLLSTAEADVEREAGTADAEDEAQLDAAGVEDEGIASGQIAGVTAAILVSVFLIAFVVFWAFYLPMLGESESVAQAGVDLTPEGRAILAEGAERLENYSLTADSSFTLPISVAMADVVERYGGSVADSALAGVAVGEVPMAVTRQGFNVAPVALGPARAVRTASSRGATTAPVPETASDAPVPNTEDADTTADNEPETSEE